MAASSQLVHAVLTCVRGLRTKWRRSAWAAVRHTNSVLAP